MLGHKQCFSGGKGSCSGRLEKGEDNWLHEIMQLIFRGKGDSELVLLWASLSEGNHHNEFAPRSTGRPLGKKFCSTLNIEQNLILVIGCWGVVHVGRATCGSLIQPKGWDDRLATYRPYSMPTNSRFRVMIISFGLTGNRSVTGKHPQILKEYCTVV